MLKNVTPPTNMREFQFREVVWRVIIWGKGRNGVTLSGMYDNPPSRPSTMPRRDDVEKERRGGDPNDLRVRFT